MRQRIPRRKLGSRFGAHPELPRVIVCAIHQAFFGRVIGHPDSKRQRKTRMRDLTFHYSRKLKEVA